MPARPWPLMPHRSSSHPTRTDRYQPEKIERAMKLSHFFIDHPRFAAVVSIFIVVFGLAAAAFLPVAQYPNIVPPTVQITASYPGASADVVARTVATPLEQAIHGVENMDYISSQSTGNGLLTITVIFKIGTDVNTELMLTHNRVQDTLSRLP